MRKTIRNRKKRLCALCNKTTWENLQIADGFGEWSEYVTDLFSAIYRLSQMVFITSRNLTRNLYFLFLIVMAIISFFRWEAGRWSPASDHLISVLHPLYMSRNLRDADRRERVLGNGNCQRTANFSTTVMTIWEMRNEKCKFWQGKVWTQRQWGLCALRHGIQISMGAIFDLPPSEIHKMTGLPPKIV